MNLTKQILVKAQREPEFREQLLRDPKAAIERGLGVQVPSGVKVHIHENSDAAVHLVLPAMAAGRALSDGDLEMVAGGRARSGGKTLPTSTPPNTGWWEC